MMRSFIEKVMEKNKDSRKIKSRHAKVSRTGRNLEESLMAAGGIIAYTQCEIIRQAGEKSRRAIRHKRRVWATLCGCVWELRVKTQPGALRNIPSWGLLLLGVSEWEVPEECVKSARKIIHFGWWKDHFSVVQREKLMAKAEKQPEGCRSSQRGPETDVEGEKKRGGGGRWSGCMYLRSHKKKQRSGMERQKGE